MDSVTPAVFTSPMTRTRDTIRAGGGDTQSIRHLQRKIAEHLAGPDGDDNPPPVPPPQTGDHVGPYVLQAMLGRGSSCYVFRGWDESQRLPVALKIINWENVFDHAAALRQMRVEAVTLSLG